MAEELTLVDRWEELGQEHMLTIDQKHDPWPRTVCWTRFAAGCSCGASYPVISATENEVWTSPHLGSYVDVHRQLHHMMHLRNLLLDEDWMPIDHVITGEVPDA